MPFANVSGVRIHYQEDGDISQPVIVLLNSIGTDHSLWDKCIASLSSSFRLLRIDTRGHGKSDAPDGEYTLAMLASDVVAVMDTSGVSHADVAGVSLGGMIAMQMALGNADRVCRIALICTSATMGRSAWEDRIALVRSQGLEAIGDLAIERFLSPRFRMNHPDEASELRGRLIGMSASGYAAAGAAIRDMDLSDKLGEIAIPTLVITGSEDISTPFCPHGRFLLEHIPGSEHVEIDSAHLPPVEKPDVLCAELKGFLRKPVPIG